MRKVLTLAGTLGGFSMAAAAILAGGNLLTADVIEMRIAEDLEASLAQVLPPSLHDNHLLENPLTIAGPGPEQPATTVYRATKDGAVTGMAYQVTAKGYGGDIRLLLGVAPDGTLLGVRTLSHSETPGLGDRIDASRSDWIKGFTGRSLGDPPEAAWGVQKDGGAFDQFAGATITPRAVVGAIRDGLQFYHAHRDALLAPKPGDRQTETEVP